MSESPAITRCALLTPLGDAPATWNALRAERRVAARCAVDDGLLDSAARLDRSIRLALAAARQVLPEAPPHTADTALFCATSKGPVLTMLAALDRLRIAGGPDLAPDQARQIALGVGAMGTLLAERLGLASGHTSVAACSSGMHALHRAAQAVHCGACARALVVAADASLHPLFEASFARLGVLAPADAQGIRRCEPFAENGAGFFLSEAGAALLLERHPSPGTQPLALLEDSWIGGDASALIAIDPDTDALRRGLAACRGADPPAFVHAHATGTSHDAFELQAIRAVCGSVDVFSHKQWLGHSLGAAGLVSVVLSALCHHHRTSLTGRPIPAGTRSLTIAQGFGGHLAVVRLCGTSHSDPALPPCFPPPIPDKLHVTH